MDDQASRDELIAMLGLSSAETRYGAFRALWAMNPSHASVQGDPAVKDFSYLVLNAGGPAMVHVTRSRRPEVVLFGRDQQLRSPLAINAGPYIQVTGHDSGMISLSKYMPGQADQKRVVSTNLDDVIRAIVDLGGTYPDVVQALEEAKSTGVLASRFEVDALPNAGRSYERVVEEGSSAKPASDKPPTRGQNPVPNLFSSSDGPSRSESPAEGDKSAQSTDSAGKRRPLRDVFARMMGRDPK